MEFQEKATELIKAVDSCFYDIMEMASGKVDITKIKEDSFGVDPLNYEKRVRVLIYQLPEDAIREMEMYEAVDALKEWKLGVWKEDARKLLDEQDRYTHDDVVDAFIEYHSRINKLKEIEASTSEEL